MSYYHNATHTLSFSDHYGAMLHAQRDTLCAPELTRLREYSEMRGWKHASTGYARHLVELPFAVQCGLDQSIARIFAVAKSLSSRTKLAFSGSMAKRTFVCGSSDLDLLCLSRDWLAESPVTIVDGIACKLENSMRLKRYSTHLECRTSQGVAIDVVPAACPARALLFPDCDGVAWIPIYPGAFAESLLETDCRSNGILIPAIRVVKLFLSHPHVPVDVSGHHVETMSLQIATQEGIPETCAECVRHLLGHAPRCVEQAIPDSSLQTTYVDAYLGAEGSKKRADCARGLRKAGELLHVLLH